MSMEIRMEAVRGNRAELREKIYNYVIEDDHRLEVFTDIEICTEDDQAECIEELLNSLNEMSTNEMEDIVERIEHADDYDTYEEIFFNTTSRVKCDDDTIRILLKGEDIKKALNLLDQNDIDWEMV